MTGDINCCDVKKFAAFRESLRGYFGDAVFESWMSSIELDRYECGEAVLSVKSGAQADRVNQRHRTPVRKLFCNQYGPVDKFSIVSRKALSESAKKAALHAGVSAAAGFADRTLAGFEFGVTRKSDLSGLTQEASRSSPSGSDIPLSVSAMSSPLLPQCTFDTFAEDDSNAIALKAARRIFQNSNAPLIYIYGESGVGKSHLMSAIGHAWAERFPEKPYAYIKHANLRDGCKAAVRSGHVYGLTQDFLTRELVLFDDMHRLENAKRTLEELANLIDAFVAVGRQVVIVGDRSPQALADEGFDRRLTDRLSGGLTAEIKRGAEALRIEVLRKRRDADVLACEIGDDAIEFIAHNFPKSMREAIGMYNQLALVHGDKPQHIGASEAQATLRNHLYLATGPATIDDALTVTAEVFGLTVEDLKGRVQQQAIAQARHSFVMVGRERLKESFPRLSKALGRDHTTAMSGYQRALALHERYPEFREKVSRICDRLGV